MGSAQLGLYMGPDVLATLSFPWERYGMYLSMVNAIFTVALKATRTPCKEITTGLVEPLSGCDPAARMIARVMEGQGSCGNPQGHRGKEVAS